MDILRNLLYDLNKAIVDAVIVTTYMFIE